MITATEPHQADQRPVLKAQAPGPVAHVLAERREQIAMQPAAIAAVVCTVPCTQ